MHVMTCDMCGVELEQHGLRYTLRISKVPAIRSAGQQPYDLCAICAAKLKMRLGRRETPPKPDGMADE